MSFETEWEVELGAPSALATTPHGLQEEWFTPLPLCFPRDTAFGQRVPGGQWLATIEYGI